jgi:hypothetical protein
MQGDGSIEESLSQEEEGQPHRRGPDCHSFQQWKVMVPQGQMPQLWQAGLLGQGVPIPQERQGGQHRYTVHTGTKHQL